MVHVNIAEPKGYWRVFHSHGCKKVAIYSKNKPMRYMSLIASDSILIDGSIPKHTDLLICGSCNKQINLGECVAEDSTIVE